jgi:hypothetical protein
MDQVRFAGCSSAFLHIGFTYAFQPFLSRILEETDLTGADFQVTVRTGKNSRQKSAGYIPIKMLSKALVSTLERAISLYAYL